MTVTVTMATAGSAPGKHMGLSLDTEMTVHSNLSGLLA